MSESHGEWVVASPAMKRVRERCLRLGPTKVGVIIYGPSGAGKERVAQALHHSSTRAGSAFVAVNSSAIAPGLAESAFFGHERGAFTGAVRRHAGFFERAHGGTLFLDEVAELPLELQAKLLRVLDCGAYTAVGSVAIKKVDVRILCATHRDLRELVRAGRFREDLYYRIAGARIVVPPLCDRPDDIVALGSHFLQDLSAESVVRFSNDARQLLKLHDWPGNVRELRSVVRLAVLHARTDTVDAEMVREAIAELSTRAIPSFDPPLEEALRQAGGNVSAAARRLGVPRETLRDRLARRYQDAPAVPLTVGP